MIPRYSHPTVSELYSDEWTYGAWLRIEAATLDTQRLLEVVPADPTADLARWINLCHIDESAAGQIRAIERQFTHHDVGAFLVYLRKARKAEDGKWIHYGLTSSDLVDTAQAMRFKKLHRIFLGEARDLFDAIATWTQDETPMVGLTHGQAGEPTSMRARAMGWVAEIEHAVAAVGRYASDMRQMKLSGPMGTYAHNPPEVEAAVAKHLDLRTHGAVTQIVPRGSLGLWAGAAAGLLAACAKVGHDLRLLAMLGEVYFERTAEHVGSSAMPHKNNPIEAEKVAGLARLARGYAVALEPGMLWLERDISNSSVERVAVPDLWHVLFNGMLELKIALNHMKLRPGVIEAHVADRANELWSHRETLAWIADGYTYTESREAGREVQVETYDVMGDAKWWMRNYPGAK